jgi:hypothetical protein
MPMKFFKFWAPGEATVETGRRPWKLRAYGGSNDSLEDAKRRAREVAERAAGAIAAGRPFGDYDYSERPLREEIVDEIRDGQELIAVITRNSYGSLVLNTNHAMFVDVDYAPGGTAQSGSPPPLGDVVKQLWGLFTGKAASNSAAPAVSRDDALLERFERVTRSHVGLGIRVYRTAAGFRLLATSGRFEPESAEVAQLLSEFGSDALYTRLCKAQQCFRARLTAKFWRCGAAKPPSRFPWINADEESTYRRWEQAYHQRANQHATCTLVASFGAPAIHPAVAAVVETHDRLTMNAGAKLG